MSRHVVASVSEIPPGGCKRVEVAGRGIAVFNLKGEFYALLDRCPHEGGSLSCGFRVGTVESDEPGHYRLAREGEMVKCPWHGWEFDIRTGQSWSDPEGTRVRTYTASVEEGRRIVEGPYVAETFPVSVEEDYVIVEV